MVGRNGVAALASVVAFVLLASTATTSVAAAATARRELCAVSFPCFATASNVALYQSSLFNTSAPCPCSCPLQDFASAYASSLFSGHCPLVSDPAIEIVRGSRDLSLSSATPFAPVAVRMYISWTNSLWSATVENPATSTTTFAVFRRNEKLDTVPEIATSAPITTTSAVSLTHTGYDFILAPGQSLAITLSKDEIKKLASIYLLFYATGSVDLSQYPVTHRLSFTLAINDSKWFLFMGILGGVYLVFLVFLLFRGKWLFRYCKEKAIGRSIEVVDSDLDAAVGCWKCCAPTSQLRELQSAKRDEKERMEEELRGFLLEYSELPGTTEDQKKDAFMVGRKDWLHRYPDLIERDVVDVKNDFITGVKICKGLPVPDYCAVEGRMLPSLKSTAAALLVILNHYSDKYILHPRDRESIVAMPNIPTLLSPRSRKGESSGDDAKHRNTNNNNNHNNNSNNSNNNSNNKADESETSGHQRRKSQVKIVKNLQQAEKLARLGAGIVASKVVANRRKSIASLADRKKNGYENDGSGSEYDGSDSYGDGNSTSKRDENDPGTYSTDHFDDYSLSGEDGDLNNSNAGNLSGVAGIFSAFFGNDDDDYEELVLDSDDDLAAADSKAPAMIQSPRAHLKLQQVMEDNTSSASGDFIERQSKLLHEMHTIPLVPNSVLSSAGLVETARFNPSIKHVIQIKDYVYERKSLHKTSSIGASGGAPGALEPPPLRPRMQSKAKSDGEEEEEEDIDDDHNHHHHTGLEDGDRIGVSFGGFPLFGDQFKQVHTLLQECNIDTLGLQFVQLRSLIDLDPPDGAGRAFRRESLKNTCLAIFQTLRAAAVAIQYAEAAVAEVSRKMVVASTIPTDDRGNNGAASGAAGSERSFRSTAHSEHSVRSTASLQSHVGGKKKKNSKQAEIPAKVLLSKQRVLRQISRMTHAVEFARGLRRMIWKGLLVLLSSPKVEAYYRAEIRNDVRLKIGIDHVDKLDQLVDTQFQLFINSLRGALPKPAEARIVNQSHGHGDAAAPGGNNHSRSSNINNNDNSSSPSKAASASPSKAASASPSKAAKSEKADSGHASHAGPRNVYAELGKRAEDQEYGQFLTYVSSHVGRRTAASLYLGVGVGTDKDHAHEAAKTPDASQEPHIAYAKMATLLEHDREIEAVSHCLTHLYGEFYIKMGEELPHNKESFHLSHAAPIVARFKALLRNPTGVDISGRVAGWVADLRAREDFINEFTAEVIYNVTRFRDACIGFAANPYGLLKVVREAIELLPQIQALVDASVYLEKNFKRTTMEAMQEAKKLGNELSDAQKETIVFTTNMLMHIRKALDAANPETVLAQIVEAHLPRVSGPMDMVHEIELGFNEGLHFGHGTQEKSTTGSSRTPTVPGAARAMRALQRVGSSMSQQLASRSSHASSHNGEDSAATATATTEHVHPSVQLSNPELPEGLAVSSPNLTALFNRIWLIAMAWTPYYREHDLFGSDPEEGSSGKKKGKGDDKESFAKQAAMWAAEKVVSEINPEEIVAQMISEARDGNHAGSGDDQPAVPKNPMAEKIAILASTAKEKAKEVEPPNCFMDRLRQVLGYLGLILTAAIRTALLLVLLLFDIAFFRNMMSALPGMYLVPETNIVSNVRTFLQNQALLRSTVPAVLEKFFTFIDSIDLANKLHSWDCDGIALIALPTLLALCLFLVFLSLRLNVLVIFSIGILRWTKNEDGTSKGGVKVFLIEKLSSILTTGTIYVLRTLLSTFGSLALATSLRSPARTCSTADSKFALIARPLFIIFSLLALILAFFTFSGKNPRSWLQSRETDEAGEMISYAVSKANVWTPFASGHDLYVNPRGSKLHREDASRPARAFSYLVQLIWNLWRAFLRLMSATFGIWTNELLLSYEILTRSYVFNFASAENPDNMHMKMILLMSNAHAMFWLLIPYCAIVCRLQEALNNPPLILMGRGTVATPWQEDFQFPCVNFKQDRSASAVDFMASERVRAARESVLRMYEQLHGSNNADSGMFSDEDSGNESDIHSIGYDELCFSVDENGIDIDHIASTATGAASHSAGPKSNNGHHVEFAASLKDYREAYAEFKKEQEVRETYIEKLLVMERMGPLDPQRSTFSRLLSWSANVLRFIALATILWSDSTLGPKLVVTAFGWEFLTSMLIDFGKFSYDLSPEGQHNPNPVNERRAEQLHLKREAFAVASRARKRRLGLKPHGEWFYPPAVWTSEVFT